MRPTIIPPRGRFAVIAGVAAAVALAALISDDLNVFDPGLFRDAGSQLFSASWADVFADPDVQIGPLQVLFFAIVGALDAVVPGPWATTLSLCVQVPLAVTAAMAARALVCSTNPALSDARVGAAELVAGAGSVVVGVTWTAYQTTQIGEAVAPLAWIFAATWSVRGRVVAAGIVLGCAMAVKLWAVLGLPLLLLAPDMRRVVPGAVAALVGAALWAPFLLFGDVATLDYRWPMWPEALLRFLDPDGIYFTWPMRLVQGLAAVATGTAAALWLRRSHIGIWIVPLVIATVKVLLDPAFWYWYWIPIDLFVLFGLAGTLVLVGGVARVLGGAALATVLFLPPGSRLIATALLVAATVVAAVYAPRRRSTA